MYVCMYVLVKSDTAKNADTDQFRCLGSFQPTPPPSPHIFPLVRSKRYVELGEAYVGSFPEGIT